LCSITIEGYISKKRWHVNLRACKSELNRNRLPLIASRARRETDSHGQQIRRSKVAELTHAISRVNSHPPEGWPLGRGGKVPASIFLKRSQSTAYAGIINT